MNGFVYKPESKKNDGVNNVQGEESDFEFMEIEEPSIEELNERVKTRKTYFEFWVMKQELNPLVKLLLEKGYSISKAFTDAFRAGNYQQLFQMLSTMNSDTVKDAVKMKDDKGRNLFHSLSKAPENTAFVEICKKLIEDYHLDPTEEDNEGNTPIMLAAQEGKYELVKALELNGCSVIDVNHKKENSIHLLLKGKRIKKYNKRMLKYLIDNGVDINEPYEELIYSVDPGNMESENKNYKWTPLIHIIRTDLLEKWQKGEILDDILLQSKQRINPNISDSEGKDVFMHLAINNEFDLWKYLIINISTNYKRTKQHDVGYEEIDDKQTGDAISDEIGKVNLKNTKAKTIQEAPEKIQIPVVEEENEEKIVTTKYEIIMQELEDKQKLKDKRDNTELQENGNANMYKFGINLANTDNIGKSVIHYIINPLDYGSYENQDFLNYMLKFGFKGDIADNNRMKPYEYAKDLSSDSMLNTLKLFNAAPLSWKLNIQNCWFKKIEDWEEVDYLKDSQDYLDLAKMDIDKKSLVPWDPVGKFNDDWEVFEDPENGIYDCHLTRVDIGREAKDDYLFYKLQIVHDKGRDLWMLFTRWGRIGEEGAFQKTPYSKEECIKEFETIFLSKTKNEWKDRKDFKKHFWKYQLININYANVWHKDYLVPFDFSKSKESNLSPKVQEILREITQVAMYVKGIKNSGIDTDQMPFSNINRNDLLKARESLMRLREILEELEPLESNLNRFNRDGKDKIISLREKMWYHSSRFYEMIPHEQFKNEIVPPINSMAILKEKADMIDNLLNFEMASKILLGAHKNAKEINPLDYWLKSMGIEIEPLDKSTSEFNILKDYCVRTWPENNNANKKIKNIFKIQRRGEGEQFEEFKELGNRFLLYHGSRISNFMGICSQGLRVAPPEAPKTGYMFGKGVYFADMLQKSYNYWNDFNATQDWSKFMLLCEVAIGKSYKLTHAQYMDQPPAGYDSTAGLGTSGPCYSKIFTFPEGYSIPMGKYLDYEYEENTKKNVYLRHNEFIIYKSDESKHPKLKNNRFTSESNPGQIKMRYLIQIK